MNARTFYLTPFICNMAGATTPNVRKRKGDDSLNRRADGHATENGSIASSAPKTSKSDTSPSSPAFDVLQIWAPMLFLIFGGCCSNVYTLESLIHASPSSGHLITAFQFLVTALITLPKHVSLSRGWQNLYLEQRTIPITKWIVYTAFFLVVNILNNKAFNYRISVPLHIILRSAGPVSTMIVGRIVAGRTYPAQKIVAVVLLFIGVVVAALADSHAKQPETSFSANSASNGTLSSSALWNQWPGFALLAAALFLSAFMGLYTEDLYRTYGHSGDVTSESLFYSHALPLSYFATTVSSIRPELVNLAMTSPSLSTTLVSSTSFPPTSALTGFLNVVPTALIMLLLNAITQYLCISGVNSLSAKSSSLTVSIVLNIRKLVSLILSIWLFGNSLPLGVLLGAGLVFAGGGLYALPTAKRADEGSKERSKKEL